MWGVTECSKLTRTTSWPGPRKDPSRLPNPLDHSPAVRTSSVWHLLICSASTGSQDLVVVRLLLRKTVPEKRKGGGKAAAEQRRRRRRGTTRQTQSSCIEEKGQNRFSAAATTAERRFQASLPFGVLSLHHRWSEGGSATTPPVTVPLACRLILVVRPPSKKSVRLSAIENYESNRGQK